MSTIKMCPCGTHANISIGRLTVDVFTVEHAKAMTQILFADLKIGQEEHDHLMDMAGLCGLPTAEELIAQIPARKARAEQMHAAMLAELPGEDDLRDMLQAFAASGAVFIDLSPPGRPQRRESTR